MTKRRRLLACGIIALVAIGVFASRHWFSSAPVDRSSASVASPLGKTKGGSRSQEDPKPATSAVEIPEADQEVRDARSTLRELEISRIGFSRNYEDENNFYYDYVLGRASKAQQEEIMNLCSSVKGLSRDWFDNRQMSWSQKLSDEFLLPAEYEYYIISIAWKKDGTGGDYTIGGIEPGKLAYDANGSPTSSDGKFNIIRMGAPFKTGKDWRFAHLLEAEEE